LVEAATAQAEHQASEEPTQQFRELLEAAIGGDAHLADAQTDEKPENPGRWGWRYGLDEWSPRGKRIGWVAGDGSLLLEPGSAFAMAQRTARDQGVALPVNPRTMWKRLHEKGLLASRDVARGRNTTRATIDGNRRTVIHLIPAALLPEDDPNGPNDPPPDERGGSGPKMRAVLPAPHPETAPNPPKTDTKGRKGRKGHYPVRCRTMERSRGRRLARHIPTSTATLGSSAQRQTCRPYQRSFRAQNAWHWTWRPRASTPEKTRSGSYL
jgi:hypothetical protein